MIGSPTSPLLEATGGPEGNDDGFLRLEATGGSGPGSRLSVTNGIQWSGNYLTAGVTGIRLSVRNFGPSDLYLRLVFQSADANGAVVHLALSSNAVFVAGGGDWTTIELPIDPAQLTPALGTVVDALADTDVLRIFHNPDTAFVPGSIPAVSATLGVDDIRAIPEPGVALLVSLGLAVLAGRRPGSRCVR